MRVLIIGLTLALTASAPLAAIAQAPVTTQPLAPGEVLLELNATGSVITRADTAVVSFRAAGEGATGEEARRAAEAEAARLAGIARGAGFAADDVQILPATTVPGFDMREVPPPYENSMVSEDNMIFAAEEGPRQAQAYAMIRVRGRDFARLQPLLRAMEAAQSIPADSPTYALSDPDAARRQAQARALAIARADAEAYAAALGMRVVRIARVTERLGFDLISMMMNERALRRQAEGNDGHSPDIETSVTIGVDFALAPR